MRHAACCVVECAAEQLEDRVNVKTACPIFPARGSGTALHKAPTMVAFICLTPLSFPCAFNASSLAACMMACRSGRGEPQFSPCKSAHPQNTHIHHLIPPPTSFLSDLNLEVR